MKRGLHRAIYTFECRLRDMGKMGRADQGVSLELAAASKAFTEGFEKQLEKMRRHYHALQGLQELIEDIDSHSSEVLAIPGRWL